MTKYSRNEGHEEASLTLRMPSDEVDARTSRLSIGELLGRYEEFCNDTKSGQEMYPWASRFAMGYPLPSWQRQFKWTEEQKQRFIHSIWSGVDLGSYLVNELWEHQGAEGQLHFRKFSEVLLDGQQRLTTLQEYVTNGFAVKDAAGIPRYWRDLPKVERRRFSLITFTKATVSSWDEEVLRKVYDLRAFGGTAHTEEERALPNG